jgi:hypothetical protein
MRFKAKLLQKLRMAYRPCYSSDSFALVARFRRGAFDGYPSFTSALTAAEAEAVKHERLVRQNGSCVYSCFIVDSLSLECSLFRRIANIQL